MKARATVLAPRGSTPWATSPPAGSSTSLGARAATPPPLSTPPWPGGHGARARPRRRVARVLLAERGDAGRVEVVAGDMFEQLPADHDLHLLSHTLHDWDEDGVRRILEVSFAALPSGGWLADHDAHLNADKTGP